MLKKLFNKNKADCAVVIVAAGNSSRMGFDKIKFNLSGLPVVIRTIQQFEQIECVSEIVVVTKLDNIEAVAKLCKDYGMSKVSQVIAGGKTRSESCLAGVTAVNSKCKYVAIHDAARPFVTAELINMCIAAAREYRSAVPGLKSVDTLRIVKDGFISGTINRDEIVRIQTPQVFETDIIKGALTYVVTNDISVTDDSSAVELMGIRTKIVDGDPDNIKLTSPEDMKLADVILNKRGETK